MTRALTAIVNGTSRGRGTDRINSGDRREVIDYLVKIGPVEQLQRVIAPLLALSNYNQRMETRGILQDAYDQCEQRARRVGQINSDAVDRQRAIADALYENGDPFFWETRLSHPYGFMERFVIDFPPRDLPAAASALIAKGYRGAATYHTLRVWAQTAPTATRHEMTRWVTQIESDTGHRFVPGWQARLYGLALPEGENPWMVPFDQAASVDLPQVIEELNSWTRVAPQEDVKGAREIYLQHVWEPLYRLAERAATEPALHHESFFESLRKYPLPSGRVRKLRFYFSLPKNGGVLIPSTGQDFVRLYRLVLKGDDEVDVFLGSLLPRIHNSREWEKALAVIEHYAGLTPDDRMSYLVRQRGEPYQSSHLAQFVLRIDLSQSVDGFLERPATGSMALDIEAGLAGLEASVGSSHPLNEAALYLRACFDAADKANESELAQINSRIQFAIQLADQWNPSDLPLAAEMDILLGEEHFTLAYSDIRRAQATGRAGSQEWVALGRRMAGILGELDPRARAQAEKRMGEMQTHPKLEGRLMGLGIASFGLSDTRTRVSSLTTLTEMRGDKSIDVSLEAWSLLNQHHQGIPEADQSAFEIYLAQILQAGNATNARRAMRLANEGFRNWPPAVRHSFLESLFSNRLFELKSSSKKFDKARFDGELLDFLGKWIPSMSQEEIAILGRRANMQQVLSLNHGGVFVSSSAFPYFSSLDFRLEPASRRELVSVMLKSPRVQMGRVLTLAHYGGQGLALSEKALALTTLIEWIGGGAEPHVSQDLLTKAYANLAEADKDHIRREFPLTAHPHHALVLYLLSAQAGDGVFDSPAEEIWTELTQLRSPLLPFLGAHMRAVGEPGANVVWSRLGLRSIQFSDGGNGSSPIPGVMEGYLTHTPAAYDSPPDGTYKSVRTVHAAFLEGESVTSSAIPMGRTEVYAREGGDLAVKYQRPGERLKDLASEAQWFDRVRGIEGIRSYIPKALTEESGKPNLGKPKIFQFEDGRNAIAFKASKDYYRYLDESDVEDGEFQTGLLNGVHDIFLLARHGIYHTVPIMAFHNAEPGHESRPSGDRGRFVTMPDIVFGYVGRRGMGRFDNWPSALRHANIGVSGMRDYGELATLNQIMTDDRWAPQLRRLQGKPNAEALYDAAILQQTLVAGSLFVGQRLAGRINAEDRVQSAWTDDAYLRPYADQLLELHSVAYAARNDLGIDGAREIMRSRADWLRMARQMAFFMTGAHAPYLSPGAPTSDFPLQKIYGQGVVIDQPVMGPYRGGRDNPISFDNEVGCIGPSGDRASLSIGTVNGQFSIRELEKSMFAVFLNSAGARTFVTGSGGGSGLGGSGGMDQAVVRARPDDAIDEGPEVELADGLILEEALLGRAVDVDLAESTKPSVSESRVTFEELGSPARMPLAARLHVGR